MIRVRPFAALTASAASLIGCGGATASTVGLDASTAQDVDGTEVSPDAHDVREASAPDGETDAASCDELAAAASDAIAPILQGNETCQVDEDCVLSNWTCVAPCGLLINKTGVADLAASDFCAAFNKAGCVQSVSPCPQLVFDCNGGVCSSYSYKISLVSPTFMTGACMPVSISYLDGPGGSAVDTTVNRAVTLKTASPFSSGMCAQVYGDMACTAPLAGGGVTIPAGSDHANFWAMFPLDAGSCELLAYAEPDAGEAIASGP